MLDELEHMNDRCPLCSNQVVKTAEDNWYEITGWVRGIKKDSLCLRALTGLVAHNSCIEKAKQGIHPEDQPMFEIGE